MAKILVIDDEETFTNLLCAKLEKSCGYEILKAHDGAQGLELAKTGKPDLIILDIMMPVMDGFEFFSRLLKDNELSSIPVVVVSAAAQQGTMAWFMRLGAKEYLSKPVDLDKIAETIKQVIENK